MRNNSKFQLIKFFRGAVWKPSVTPIGPSPTNNISPVTKTSLAANKQQVCKIDGHNSAARPFVMFM